MKVICIQSASYCHNNIDGTTLPPTKLNIGGEYNVIDGHNYSDGYYYELLEIKRYNGMVRLFHSRMFAQVSDIDETELVNEKMGATV